MKSTASTWIIYIYGAGVRDVVWLRGTGITLCEEPLVVLLLLLLLVTI